MAPITRSLAAAIGATTIALAAGCGDGGSFRNDPDVKAIVDLYEEAGFTDEEIDANLDKLEETVDAIPEDQRDEYLAMLRNIAESLGPLADEFEPIDPEEWP